MLPTFPKRNVDLVPNYVTVCTYCSRRVDLGGKTNNDLAHIVRATCKLNALCNFCIFLIANTEQLFQKLLSRILNAKSILNSNN